jgi:hypothetical protein
MNYWLLRFMARSQDATEKHQSISLAESHDATTVYVHAMALKLHRDY